MNPTPAAWKGRTPGQMAANGGRVPHTDAPYWNEWAAYRERVVREQVEAAMTDAVEAAVAELSGAVASGGLTQQTLRDLGGWVGLLNRHLGARVTGADPYSDVADRASVAWEDAREKFRQARSAQNTANAALEAARERLAALEAA